MLKLRKNVISIKNCLKLHTLSTKIDAFYLHFYNGCISLLAKCNVLNLVEMYQKEKKWKNLTCSFLTYLEMNIGERTEREHSV